MTERGPRRMSRSAGRRLSRRRGFTLLEVTLAATFTAAACTAGTMLIKSVNDASAASLGRYEATASARNALACMDLLVGGARLLGYRDSNQVLFWRNDDNKDGQINAAELVLLRYNTVTSNLEELELYFPPGTSNTVINQQNLVVSLDQFLAGGVGSLTDQSPYARARALVTGVSQCRFWLDKSGLSAQLVQVTFTTSRNDGSQVFQAVLTPRSPVWNLMP